MQARPGQALHIARASPGVCIVDAGLFERPVPVWSFVYGESVTSPNALRLDRATMRQNLDRFKLRWRDRLDGWGSDAEGGLERKYAQSYWTELFECFGVTASRMDLFEQDARRASTGKAGYIDLF